MQEKRFCPYCATLLISKQVEGRVRKYCTACRAPVYENPLPASCLVVTDSKEHLLLVKRNVAPKEGHWCLPGGFMELDETPEQAALRELKEETGLSGKIEMLLGVTANPSRLYKTVLLTGYWVKDFSGIPVAGDDAADIAFFPPDQLPEIAFDSHTYFIRIYYAAYSAIH